MRVVASLSLCAITALAVLGCGPAPGGTVQLLSVGLPVTQTPPKVPDPLPVDGSVIAYGDVETTMGHAISTGAVQWADLHKNQRPEGWQLFVELTRAEASYREGRLLVALDARATLRTRYGRTFLAQTRVTCRQGAVVPVDHGAPVIFTCMEQLGKDLAGWLGQVEP
jgi:hypothetical protein